MILMIAKARNEFQSLKKAKELPNWPKQKSAILTELNQHQEKGTWKLVDLPAGITLLKNKWVFVLKKDKEGCIMKYKAWLVVKGFGQCFEQDYLEMHFPIVHIESIHTIIAIATAKHLLMQQMDVKGIYLNGTLKETIYMHQPNSFNDGTRRACHLIKTLYGLK